MPKESGRQLLLGSRILGDDELLSDCASGFLELQLIELSEDFYVRYLARRRSGGDQELHEFEFRSSGRFRFSRDYLQRGFFEGLKLRKECFLSVGSLRVLKGLVLKSSIWSTDEADLALPSEASRQELEIKCEGKPLGVNMPQRQDIV